MNLEVNCNNAKSIEGINLETLMRVITKIKEKHKESSLSSIN